MEVTDLSLDEGSRVRLGARPDTGVDLMRALAADASPTVRATLALNPAAPAEANAALARDPDERVRALLARKLGTLAPALSGATQDRLQRQTFDLLTELAADEAVRVRAAIADAVKDLPDIPRAIVLQLAQDEAVMVCEPVIRFSPLLSPGDLIALVASAPSAGTRLAVARRAELVAEVSDALVTHGGEDVILALLANGSAHIREATLDALAERSATHAVWQEPLVRRPVLTERAARTLSKIVADHLLEVLSERADLAPDLTASLRQKVAANLRDARANPPDDETCAVEPTEDALLDLARDGDAAKAATMLARAAAVPASIVRRAATLRSAKAIVSLTWKAGYSMSTAHAMQVLLARLAPDAALKPGPNNSFPLAVHEMRWQIAFLEGKA